MHPTLLGFPVPTPIAHILEFPDGVLRCILLSAAEERRDLAGLRLVLRRFDRIIRPDFWHTVTIQGYRYPTNVARLLKVLNANPQCGRLVRNLIFNAQNLSRVTVPIPNPADEPDLAALHATLGGIYSRQFVDWIRERDATLNGAYLLSLLIAHVPGLRTLCYPLDWTVNAGDTEDVLIQLLRHCSTTRARIVSASQIQVPASFQPAPVVLRAAPLMHLMHLSVCGVEFSTTAQPLVLDFPLHSLRVGDWSFRLSDHNVYPDLKDLEIAKIEFKPGALAEIFSILPRLERLTYNAYVVTHAGQQPGSEIDLDALGDLIRQKGRNLRHLDFLICPTEGLGPFPTSGAIGSLATLTALQTLTISPYFLWGASYLDINMTHFLPRSIKLVVFPVQDTERLWSWMHSVVLGRAAERLLERRDDMFPHLDGLMLIHRAGAGVYRTGSWSQVRWAELDGLWWPFFAVDQRSERYVRRMIEIGDFMNSTQGLVSRALQEDQVELWASSAPN
ncbi:hypothetical protein Micbo1qcDRAFT_207765 [Microdochium bolleyi]|uniref:Uncharacterized protein n=1 Tax=Microdochium bolleyi TaxID=196109 RepID=A0A136ISM8_9PEZI|nr:hypothetical protein Micbo1qcDRAFT_207765 [Microdochium bolleyi]